MNTLILSALVSPWRRREPQSFLDDSRPSLAAHAYVFVMSSRVKVAYILLRSFVA